MTILGVLRNRSYASLFTAQIIALIGTGLLTVALGLLAFDLAGVSGGAVMGIAMTIKIVAYVVVSPVVSALTAQLPRRPVLITADLTRAAIAMLLPFVTEVWQVYLLVFLLQSASATFTPAFQALIPSVLPDEDEYTAALSLSRLAYDMESLASPALAAALLTVVSYHDLFAGTVVGFLGSAILVARTRLPVIETHARTPFGARLTSGLRQFLGNSELRSLIALNLVVAAATAMVIVNTVVMVKGDLGRSQPDAALLLAANGAGSMLVALAMPRLLTRIVDRSMMRAGAAVLPAALLAVAPTLAWLPAPARWPMLIALWCLIGAATSAVLTPSSRLLRRNSTPQSAPAVFAAQFSLSHACYLITYPIAGIVGATLGRAGSAVVLTLVACVALGVTTFSPRDRAPGRAVRQGTA